MDYLLALAAMPIMMGVWVAVQRLAAEDPDEDSIDRGCEGCSCGRGAEACERRAH